MLTHHVCVRRSSRSFFGALARAFARFARLTPVRAMAKRGKRARKEASAPAAPASVHDVTDAFVKGGDLATIGRGVDGPFTADALRGRYKAEGATVDVDKNFSFRSLVVDERGGGTFSLFGGDGGGGDAERDERAEAARDDDVHDVHDEKRRGKDAAAAATREPGRERRGASPPASSPAHASGDAPPRESPAREAETEAEAARRRALAARARALRAKRLGLERADGSVDAATLLGLTPEALERGRAFVRPYETEEAMVEAWHATKDEAREEYKRRRRQALRRGKADAAVSA